MCAPWRKHVGEIIHFNNRSTLPWDTTHYLRFTVSPLHYVTLAYCSCLPPGKNTRVKFFTLSIDKSVASAVYCALTSLCDTCSLLMFAPWRKHVAEIIHFNNRSTLPWHTRHYLRFTVSPLHYVTLAHCSCLPPGKNTSVKSLTSTTEAHSLGTLHTICGSL